MAYFVGGLAVLGILILLGRAFVAADPRALVRAVRYSVGIILIAIGGLFSFTGRWGLGLPMIAAGVSALTIGRIGPLDLGGNTRSSGSSSAVRSRYLTMQLDHDTGAMAGTVTAGRHAGRNLDEMSDAELRELGREVAADSQSVALLEAYLDRRFPGWREDVEGDAAAGPRRTADAGPMTDEQAYQILGLAPGAGEAEIRAAHRRLMMRVHPDQGGSTFLAAKINEAKDRLLGRHR